MDRDGATDDSRYRVVVNQEEQYSILPEYLDNPPGWSDEGVSGTKEECLDHIDHVWTDMRPLSLRKRMSTSGNAKGTN